MTNPVGRPTKYKPEHDELLIKMMSQGRSVVQFCAAIGIARKTFYEWVKLDEGFSNTFTRAKTFCEAHWESELQSMMYDNKVNAPLVKMYFTNRFNWTDKQQVDNTSSDGSMTPKQITRVIVDAKSSDSNG